MDCFYASVEEKDDPSLKGKPVVVGGTGNRGVVCAANYPAREYGVRSAIPILKARQLCPMAVYLPVRMKRYVEESKKIRAIFERYTDAIQPISLDEAFLDVTQNKAGLPFATDVAKAIRREIREETGLVASAGVGPNKLVAKIASDFDKPDGLTVIPPAKVREFLDPLPVKRIWGIGRKAAEKCHRLGIDTVEDLRLADPDLILSRFGSHGHGLQEHARGIDRSPVRSDRKAKSIGRERTYEKNVADKAELLPHLERIAEDIESRLEKKNLQACTLTLKFRDSEFQSFTRSLTPGEPFHAVSEIIELGKKVLKEKVEDSMFPVRLFGLSVSHFESRESLSLFHWMAEEGDDPQD